MNAKTIAMATTLVAATVSSASATMQTTSSLCEGGQNTEAAGCNNNAMMSAVALKPKALVSAYGSGNNGESGMVPFYTFEAAGSGDESTTSQSPNLPSETKTSSSSSSPFQRTDLDLGNPESLAFYVDNLLTDAESDALASCANAIIDGSDTPRMAPGIQTPPGMRMNEAAHWFPTPQSVAEEMFAALFERFRHLVPETLDGEPLHNNMSQRLAMYRYGQGDRFNPHIDGSFPGQGANKEGDGVDEWLGIHSEMSILLYLNGAADGLEGGETRLWAERDQRNGRFVDVQPVKGRALFFRHGHGPNSVLHAGLPVQGTRVKKHVARSNVPYGVRRGTRPLY